MELSRWQARAERRAASNGGGLLLLPGTPSSCPAAKEFRGAVVLWSWGRLVKLHDTGLNEPYVNKSAIWVHS